MAYVHLARANYENVQNAKFVQNFVHTFARTVHYLLHSAPKSAHFSWMKESTQANESKATGQLTCHWVIFRERRSQQRRNEISQAMRRNIRNSSCKKQFQRRKLVPRACTSEHGSADCMHALNTMSAVHVHSTRLPRVGRSNTEHLT